MAEVKKQEQVESESKDRDKPIGNDRFSLRSGPDSPSAAEQIREAKRADIDTQTKD